MGDDDQGSLFTRTHTQLGAREDISAGLRPNARNADPETAHLAAEEARSTFLNAQCVDVLRVVATRGEPATTPELNGGMEPYRGIAKLHRRLPDLREKGFVDNGEARPCRISGRKLQTWFITPAGATFLAGLK